jgi:hypothetical protein
MGNILKDRIKVKNNLFDNPELLLSIEKILGHF